MHTALLELDGSKHKVTKPHLYQIRDRSALSTQGMQSTRRRPLMPNLQKQGLPALKQLLDIVANVDGDLHVSLVYKRTGVGLPV